jgi:hypothetical protein
MIAVELVEEVVADIRFTPRFNSFKVSNRLAYLSHVVFVPLKRLLGRLFDLVYRLV